VYDEGAVGALRTGLEGVNGNQPGDVEKGAKVIVDVLTMTGAAEGREAPMRVVLGSDAPGVVRGKCEDTIRLLEEWDGITNVTDHE